MMNTAGCNQRSAGIGDIAYVKDLLTEKIVTTKLQCSKFGLAHHRLAKFGWVRYLLLISLHFYQVFAKKDFKSDCVLFGILSLLKKMSFTPQKEDRL